MTRAFAVYKQGRAEIGAVLGGKEIGRLTQLSVKLTGETPCQLAMPLAFARQNTSRLSDLPTIDAETMVAAFIVVEYLIEAFEHLLKSQNSLTSEESEIVAVLTNTRGPLTIREMRRNNRRLARIEPNRLGAVVRRMAKNQVIDGFRDGKTFKYELAA